jgi:TonB family protein
MHCYVRSLAIAAIVAPCLAVAQSPPKAENLHDRIVEAASNSSLLSPDLSPWHLKLDATFYDAAGKNPDIGTVETWHSGGDSRTVITVGAATRTVVRHSGETYESQSGPDVPALADDLLDNVLSPGPSTADIEGATLDLHVEPFGKVKLDCIMLAQSILHASSAPMGLFPTYCLDPGATRLRASYNFGDVSVLRNRMGSFQGKNVALDVSLMKGPVLLAEAKISTLATFAPADEFTPGPDLKQIGGGQARVPGGVIAGHLLNKAQPIYPPSARQNHISGTVVLHAIIGRDGRIRSLRPISAPDADLAISAIAAVRQWTYTPYLLNGEPVEVDTTITVNYNLNPY